MHKFGQIQIQHLQVERQIWCTGNGPAIRMKEKQKERERDGASMQSNLRKTRYLGDVGLQSKQQHSKKKTNENIQLDLVLHIMCGTAKNANHACISLKRNSYAKLWKSGAVFFLSHFFRFVSCNAISETTKSERKRICEKENISHSSHLHKTHFIQVVSYKNKNYDFDIIFSAKLKDTNVWNLIFNQ